MDVVLNSPRPRLRGRLADAAAPGRRLRRDGQDRHPRAAPRVACRPPGVAYEAFDLYEAGPDAIHAMFRTVLDLFADGRVRLNPVTVRDVRDARATFREMSQGRHTGKLVLDVGGGFGGGTVLVTGGTGGVGSLVARHLVTEHGVPQSGAGRPTGSGGRQGASWSRARSPARARR
ncbi:zinc-binding dehydrogenase [Streptomyces sp. KL116D]|uniref:zinc-binding dehydrogenase n=1 Tax=Streptomyces sp. KL116D TaxID=3045152 RepID=UPI00355746D7